MTTLLHQEDVTNSVFTYWADEFPLAVTTIYPGLRVNTAELAEWIEIGLENWTEPTQRDRNPLLLETQIRVHCFVKQNTDQSRIHELADAVRDTLAHASIPLIEADTSDADTVGYLKTREMNSQDLSRNRFNAAQRELQHMLLTCDAVGQKI